MADHFSGPRALADPASDITDVFAFPSPERPGHLVLVLDVFPSATATALFSDALSYRFRLRPVTATTAGGRPAFVAGADEYDVRRPLRRSVLGRRPDGMAQAGTCTTPGGAEIPFRVGEEKPTEDARAADLRRAAAGSVLHRPGRRAGHPRAGAAGVPARGRQHRRGRQRAQHRPRARHRHGARPRHRPAAGRGRRDRDLRAPGPAGAHGPAGDQELHPAGQEVRPRQPRPRDPRPLQRRGRLRPGPDLRRRLPRPVQRQSALLRPARRQDRLAAGRPGRPPADRAAAGGLPRRRHVQAVLRRRLPRDRARRARRPPAHHLRRPIARRRHRGHSLHAAGRRRRRTADQRRRRPADPAGHPQLPLPESAPTPIRRT